MDGACLGTNNKGLFLVADLLPPFLKGFGGSVFQWHPDLEIGFAFVPNLMHWYDLSNVRGAKIQSEVIKCAAAAQGKSS